jgi:hypothetical protein
LPSRSLCAEYTWEYFPLPMSWLTCITAPTTQRASQGMVALQPRSCIWIPRNSSVPGSLQETQPPLPAESQSSTGLL